MSITVEELEKELEKKKAEVAELEIAVKVLRRMENANGKPTGTPMKPALKPSLGIAWPSSPPSMSSLVGRTMAECAVAIIRENGPTHYKKIAETAIARGYRSPRGSDTEALIQSFWATMNRDKETFASDGDGIYRLVEQETPS